MIEEVYLVNGKIFRLKNQAEEFERNIGKKIYCNNCNKCIGLVGDDSTNNCDIDSSKFSASFDIDSRGEYDTFIIEPFIGKYLCYECMNNFKNKLTEYKNLTEKLFNDFNLACVTEFNKKTTTDANKLLEKINIDNPDSLISKYVKNKEQEAKEWISEQNKEN